MRALLLQVVRKDYAHAFAARHQDVQVLVEGLRSTEAARIDCTECKVAERTVADIHTRREDRPADEIVLVHTHSGKQAPMLVLPFVLQIGSEDVHRLICLVVIAQGDVVQSVVIVLKSHGKLGRHKKQSVEFVGILSSGDSG